ncbi:MAG: DoxX family protein [Bacteroidota bacterium]
MNKVIVQVLSAQKPIEKQSDLILLVFRSLVAFAMIRTHGLKKILDIKGTMAHIPDPFGIGGELSAYIAIFANVFCASSVMLGFLTRASAFFILSLTLTGFFLVHWGDPWPIKDTPLIYSIAFFAILCLGPGKYSLDHVISNKINK